MRPFLLRTRVYAVALVLLVFALIDSHATAHMENETIPLPDETHLSLNVHLAERPAQYDPAYVIDTLQANAVEQLFGGLVDRNDATNEIFPELAKSWTVSSDGLTYTFELHPDQQWSDGSPLSATDIRYSLLRVLRPATGSPNAQLLYSIRGASAFHQGETSDEGSVGIIVESPSRLRIELEAPSRLFLDILAGSVAKVVPSSIIETYGNDWTLPENLITSGPYILLSAAETRFIYAKNPQYEHSAEVQIERITQQFIADDAEAWSKYVEGDLDTATVPQDAELTPELAEQTRHVARACTYYYGFNATVSPFDDVRVRQAFVAAIERRGLVRQTVPYAAPARTFTPPNIAGHVDGYAQDIGIGADAAYARRLLTEAGFANGAGLPGIDLWYNENPVHAAIAEYVARRWREVLNAQVIVHSVSWPELIDGIDRGDFQVWRSGWCADYPDAVYFLGDGVDAHRDGFGGWRNAAYDTAVALARVETDAGVRAQLYAQAEQILVEQDAVLAPLYFYGTRVATKPYLKYPIAYAGTPDYAEWTIARSHVPVAASGGTATSSDGTAFVEIPADAFNQAVVISIEPATAVPPTANQATAGAALEIAALDPATGVPVAIERDASVTLRFRYDEEQAAVAEESLALYFWDGTAWQREPTSNVDTAKNEVTATPGHLSRWVVLGDTNRVFAPITAR